jgi:hypothetical protein
MAARTRECVRAGAVHARGDLRPSGRTCTSARTRFLPRPRVNADARGRPNGHFHPKTSFMTSLLPMGWIQAVGKFVVVHQFAYDTVHSTRVYGSSFLYLILICVSAICRISPNRSLQRCSHVISSNRCTTNGISSLVTEVVICILLLSMILFGHSCRLSGITNI